MTGGIRWENFDFTKREGIPFAIGDEINRFNGMRTPESTQFRASVSPSHRSGEDKISIAVWRGPYGYVRRIEGSSSRQDVQAAIQACIKEHSVDKS